MMLYHRDLTPLVSWGKVEREDLGNRDGSKIFRHGLLWYNPAGFRHRSSAGRASVS